MRSLRRGFAAPATGGGASTRGRLASSGWVPRLPLCLSPASRLVWLGAPSAALSPAPRAPTSAHPPQVGALPSGGGGIPPAVVPPSPAPPASLPPSPAGGRITLNILRISAIPHPSPPRIALIQYLVQFAVAGGASPPCLRGWCPAPPASLPPHACPSRGSLRSMCAPAPVRSSPVSRTYLRLNPSEPLARQCPSCPGSPRCPIVSL